MLSKPKNSFFGLRGADIPCPCPEGLGNWPLLVMGRMASCAIGICANLAAESGAVLMGIGGPSPAAAIGFKGCMVGNSSFFLNAGSCRRAVADSICCSILPILWKYLRCQDALKLR